MGLILCWKCRALSAWMSEVGLQPCQHSVQPGMISSHLRDRSADGHLRPSQYRSSMDSPSETYRYSESGSQVIHISRTLPPILDTAMAVRLPIKSCTNCSTASTGKTSKTQRDIAIVLRHDDKPKATIWADIFAGTRHNSPPCVPMRRVGTRGNGHMPPNAAMILTVPGVGERLQGVARLRHPRFLDRPNQQHWR